jgi:hypothetical protein
MPFVDLAALDRLTQGQSPLQTPRKCAVRESQSRSLIDDPSPEVRDATSQKDVTGKWKRALN